MSKILVMEPRRMVQQAIALTLVPDHEVRLIAAMLPVEDGSIKEYDVLVVDAAALKETNSLSTEGVQALQDSGVPMIWIEDGDVELSAERDKLVVIKRPIEKKALLSAVVECLHLAEAAGTGKGFAQRNTSQGLAKSQPGKKTSGAAGAPLIELVDVVEEEPMQQNNQQTQRKKK